MPSTKEMLLVGVAAGAGGLLLGKFGGPIEAKFVAWKVPVSIAHFGLVAASATVVFVGLRAVL